MRCRAQGQHCCSPDRKPFAHVAVSMPDQFTNQPIRFSACDDVRAKTAKDQREWPRMEKCESPMKAFGCTIAGQESETEIQTAVLRSIGGCTKRLLGIYIIVTIPGSLLAAGGKPASAGPGIGPREPLQQKLSGSEEHHADNRASRAKTAYRDLPNGLPTTRSSI